MNNDTEVLEALDHASYIQLVTNVTEFIQCMGEDDILLYIQVGSASALRAFSLMMCL